MNRDEIRRQLRDSAVDQREALPRWREALRRAFDPDSDLPADERAELVGLPASRRQLLRLGGLTVVSGAVLAACGGEEDTAQVPTGSIPEGLESTTTIPASRDVDVTLVLTASSVEALAIFAYDAALEAEAFEDQTVADAAQLFRDQHAEHLDALSATARQLGATPYTDPNPLLLADVVQPGLEEVTALEGSERQRLAVDLGIALEQVAESSYVQASSILSTAELRQTIMTIGAIEAKHVSVLLAVQEEPPVPFPQARIVNAVPEDAYVTEDGPVTVPSTTTTTAAADEGS